MLVTVLAYGGSTNSGRKGELNVKSITNWVKHLS